MHKSEKKHAIYSAHLKAPCVLVSSIKIYIPSNIPRTKYVNFKYSHASFNAVTNVVTPSTHIIIYCVPPLDYNI